MWWAKIWKVLKMVPAGLWWAASVFFGGLLLGLRVMSTRWKVKDAKQDAAREREVIAGEREALRDAAEDGSNERMREELLKGLRK